MEELPQEEEDFQEGEVENTCNHLKEAHPQHQAPQLSNKLVGNLPFTFSRDKSWSKEFIYAWKTYQRANNNLYKWSMLFLTYICGPATMEWTQAMGNWVKQNTIVGRRNEFNPWLWEQTELAFNHWFMDLLLALYSTCGVPFCLTTEDRNTPVDLPGPWIGGQWSNLDQEWDYVPLDQKPSQTRHLGQIASHSLRGSGTLMICRAWDRDSWCGHQSENMRHQKRG